MERFHTFWFCIHIPGAQGIESQLLSFSIVNEIHEGKNSTLYRFMKLKAVFLFIIKPSQVSEFVITIIGETGIQGHLMSFLYQFIEQFTELLFVLYPSLLDLPINFFSDLPFGVFQE